jgi:hypothetical protein
MECSLPDRLGALTTASDETLVTGSMSEIDSIAMSAPTPEKTLVAPTNQGER